MESNKATKSQRPDVPVVLKIPSKTFPVNGSLVLTLQGNGESILYQVKDQWDKCKVHMLVDFSEQESTLPQEDNVPAFQGFAQYSPKWAQSSTVQSSRKQRKPESISQLLSQKYTGSNAVEKHSSFNDTAFQFPSAADITKDSKKVEFAHPQSESPEPEDIRPPDLEIVPSVNNNESEISDEQFQYTLALFQSLLDLSMGKQTIIIPDTHLTQYTRLTAVQQNAIRNLGDAFQYKFVPVYGKPAFFRMKEGVEIPTKPAPLAEASTVSLKKRLKKLANTPAQTGQDYIELDQGTPEFVPSPELLIQETDGKLTEPQKSHPLIREAADSKLSTPAATGAHPKSLNEPIVWASKKATDEIVHEC